MRAITIGNKEYKMKTMSVADYIRYANARDTFENKDTYGAKDIELMVQIVLMAYDNQFTEEELTDPDTGLTAAELILEFNLIENGVAEEIDTKVGKIKNS